MFKANNSILLGRKQQNFHHIASTMCLQHTLNKIMCCSIVFTYEFEQNFVQKISYSRPVRQVSLLTAMVIRLGLTSVFRQQHTGISESKHVTSEKNSPANEKINKVQNNCSPVRNWSQYCTTRKTITNDQVNYLCKNYFLDRREISF